MAHSTALRTMTEEALAHRETESARWIGIARRVLEPEERVLACVGGSTRSESEPVLVVTDRRVLVAEERLFGRWRARAELTAADVLGADVVPTRLAQSVRVHGRNGQVVELRTAEKVFAQRLVDLVNRLVADGRARR